MQVDDIPMFWNDDETNDAPHTPDNVIDVLFAIEGRSIPVDHAHALSAGLQCVAPWIRDTPGLAIHSIHVAGSQNGWERPAHGTDSVLLVSRRTKLTIRTPTQRIADLLATLEGAQLDIAGHPLRIGQGKTRPLSRETTLFARYLVVGEEPDEPTFMAATMRTLGQMGVTPKKALCGRTQSLSTPSGAITTRSLLLAGLTLDASVRLQRTGFGHDGLMGCGIFIPHKGIDPVHKH